MSEHAIKTENLAKETKKTEETTTVRYQWVKGENAGVVEIFKEDFTDSKNRKWLRFKSGRRVNPAVLTEYMINIYKDSDIIPIEKIDDSSFTNAKPGDTLLDQPQVSPPQAKVSPIKSLFDRQKELESRKIDFPIELKLPTKKFYTLIQELFDQEAIDELLDIIMDQIDMDEIKKELRVTLDDIMRLR